MIGYSQTSYIQVVAEPEISIFLDGEFKGLTSLDFGGLIIKNVSVGDHIIKVVKERYLPREETITIKTGEVFSYQVDKNFVPLIKVSEKGSIDNQTISIKQGKLKLQSLPIGINISIPSLKIDQLKTKDEWIAEPIPEGTFNVSFKWNGKEISDVLEIKNEMMTYAFVNMIDGKIEKKSISPINTLTNVNNLDLSNSNKRNEVLIKTTTSYNLKGRAVITSPVLDNTNWKFFFADPSIQDFINEHNAEVRRRNCRSNILLVNIEVDRNGQVINVNIPLDDKTLYDFNQYVSCQKAAKNTKFNSKQNAPKIQKGSIQYEFEKILR